MVLTEIGNFSENLKGWINVIQMFAICIVLICTVMKALYLLANCGFSLEKVKNG